MRLNNFLTENSIQKLFDLYLKEAAIQSKGWTMDSIKKFGKTIGKMPDEDGFFDACVTEMTPKEGFGADKAKGFCASIKDKAYGSTNWRGKDKPKSDKPKSKI